MLGNRGIPVLNIAEVVKHEAEKRPSDGYPCYFVEPVFSETDDPDRIGENIWSTRMILGFRRADTGETHGQPYEFGIGAMWQLWWYPKNTFWDNETEPPLCVRTPGGDWVIDSRANNCTRKDDRTHRCWIRHGVVPLVTVDKKGISCQAGAGSIQCGSYHGFLRNGVLVKA